MRKQFVKTTQEILASNPDTVLMLGDIGVFGFREAFEKHPDRVYNVGILEQAMVGMAAGMALGGFTPIVHTIAPFLVERAFEQLKVDFGYQRLKGIFVGVGGSYDYSGLGCTHHCPADVNLIENIPGFDIYVPGHPAELDMVMRMAMRSKKSSYIRMSEVSNHAPFATYDGMTVVQDAPASHLAVVAVGPCLDMVLAAAIGLPVNVLYTASLSTNVRMKDSHVVVVEPYYSSHLASRLWEQTGARCWRFSPPRKFVEHYGSRDELHQHASFDKETLRTKLEQWIDFLR